MTIKPPKDYAEPLNQPKKQSKKEKICDAVMITLTAFMFALILYFQI